MTRETGLSLLRTLLTALGAFFVGKVIVNQTITEDLFQLIIGAVVAIASSVWGFFDKEANIEAWQSGIRSIIIAAGGIGVAFGLINETTLQAIIGIVTALAPFILSYISKLKSSKLKQGALPVQVLKDLEGKPKE